MTQKMNQKAVKWNVSLENVGKCYMHQSTEHEDENGS